MSDNLKHYALRCLSSDALKKADELNLNPDSYSYKALSDPRREGYYMYVMTEGSEVVFSRPFKSLEAMSEDYRELEITIVN